MDAVVEVRRAAGLKIGAAAGFDQQSIASEQELLYRRVDEVGVVVVRVSGREQRMQRHRPHAERLSLLHADVGAGQIEHLGVGDPALRALLEPARAGEVIGMDVGLQRRHQGQSHVLEHLQVAFRGIQHGIDEDCLPRLLAADEIGVGARVGF